LLLCLTSKSLSIIIRLKGICACIRLNGKYPVYTEVLRMQSLFAEYADISTIKKNQINVLDEKKIFIRNGISDTGDIKS